MAGNNGFIQVEELIFSKIPEREYLAYNTKKVILRKDLIMKAEDNETRVRPSENNGVLFYITVYYGPRLNDTKPIDIMCKSVIEFLEVLHR